ncbi:MAG: DUF134 domain-containing protein [Anaerofustis stercorihominis]|nr:DUF134 domain-containing protein [Anaerofustis stercorihominis]
MGRPRKYRQVCKMPSCTQFAPMHSGEEETTVVMSIDEYEVIRLIDLNKMTQEECARQMNIARTTVQKVYDEARNKLARFIVDGAKLVIDGGDVRYCENDECIALHGKPCRCRKN